jgi:hypothetical protein
VIEEPPHPRRSAVWSANLVTVEPTTQIGSVIGESTALARRRNSGRVLLVLVLAFSMVGGIGAGLLYSFQTAGAAGEPSVPPRASDVPPPTATTSAATTATPVETPSAESLTPVASPSATTPYEGAVLPITPAAVAADCQAPPATDDAGNPVTYLPPNMVDGNPNTAWRCDGDGIGHTITINLGAETPIAELGLINGYAKLDPKSNAHRYPEYRRITAVTWSFPDGTTVQQTFADNAETSQTVRIPVHTASVLTLTIEGSTAPGLTAKTRDAVLISEISVARPA